MSVREFTEESNIIKSLGFIERSAPPNMILRNLRNIHKSKLGKVNINTINWENFFDRSADHK